MTTTAHNSYVITVPSPDGEMFVNCIEDKGKLFRVEVYIGKAGSALAAWANSASSLVNLALENDVDISSIICNLLGISSDKSTKIGNIEIKSGPDSLAVGLVKYKRLKLEESLEELRIIYEDEEGLDVHPRIANRKYRIDN